MSDRQPGTVAIRPATYWQLQAVFKTRPMLFGEGLIMFRVSKALFPSQETARAAQELFVQECVDGDERLAASDLHELIVSELEVASPGLIAALMATEGPGTTGGDDEAEP